MEVWTIVIAVATGLTAFFSAVHLLHIIDANRIRVFRTRDGGFIVENPLNHSILVRKIVAAKGELRTLGEIPVDAKTRRLKWGAFGRKELPADIHIDAKGQECWEEGISYNGIRCVVRGKARRVNFFNSDHVDIILTPGEPFIREG
jgi:hypothetical protein